MASEFGRRAFNYYRGLGYQPVQAAALAGNAMAESGGDPTIKGDAGKALGIFQWHPDRQARLTSYAQSQGLDPRSEQAQLGFFDWELKNTERRAGEMLRSAQTPKQAQAAVLASLRPHGFSLKDPTQSHNYGGRLKNVMTLLGMEGGGVTPTDPTALSAATPTPSTQTTGTMTDPSKVAMTKEDGLLGGLNDLSSLIAPLIREQQLQQLQQQQRMQDVDLGPGIGGGRFVPLTGFRGLI